MALDTTSHDIYRGTSGLELPKEVSDVVIQGAIAQSAVMKLAQRIYLPGRGLAIPVITADPTVSIVNEAAEKPVSNSTFSNKNMVPKKFAVVELFSMEFRRDMPRLYDALIDRLPGALAKAFDRQALTQAALSGFDSLVTAQAITEGSTIAEKIQNGIQAIAADGYRLNGYAAGPIGEAELITAVDGTGRPLFMPSTADASVGRVYGGEVVPCAAVQGIIGGDWSKAYYGIVDGINVKFSEEATINDGSAQINLWQRNMFAVLIEAEMGFVCADTDAFFQIPPAGVTGATGA
ncbi:MAG: phage major capsid protein [Eggerthellaceae bacterium]|nr:phage major capsid protein [Eggerthellaceae bacterium]